MIQLPKGTKDILPEETYKWQYVENVISNICKNYGIKEIRTPVFEYTELFQRGVGDTTDIVQKEMYTFDDKGGRSITLRPEGTAGVARSYIEHGMSSLPGPIKLYYIQSMYRYENVQKGRYREFNQFGIEFLNTKSADADIEMILIANQLLQEFKIEDVEININSIGCPTCRKNYQEELKKYFAKNIDEYCPTCKTRYERNPMRMLDCKEKKCKELNAGAPSILDYLCEECEEHFSKVKNGLDALDIKYKIDSRIVRGLDYYTKTVFEIISKKDGYAILAGGRYDGLIEEVGGSHTPCIGFATGMERLISLVDETKVMIKQQDGPKLYIATIGQEPNMLATKLVNELRKNNIYVEKDISDRSLKAQFKYADKIKSEYVLTIGGEELDKMIGKIKNMKTGEEVEINLQSSDIQKVLNA